MVQYEVSEVGSLQVVALRSTSIASKVLSALSSLGVPGEEEYPSRYGREETSGYGMIGNPSGAFSKYFRSEQV